jgi:hypothetical protein
MPINWEEAYNRLFEIINTKNGDNNAPYYLTGPQFIDAIKTVDYGLPRNYSSYMAQLKAAEKSQSRVDWNKALLDSLNAEKRREAYVKLIAAVEFHNPPGLNDLKAIFGLERGDEAIKIVTPPDPGMAQAMYNDIIQTINRAMKSFEHKKSLYSAMGEEDIRDYLISHLEGRYASTTATREALNKSGKTDILIKHSDQTNLFVAECKFWTGQAEFTATINQLFNLYLTWRDSKAAVIIFVDNVNITPVLATIKATIQSHPYFVRYVKDTDQSSFSYIFHFPHDPGKEVQLEVMIYHFAP